MVVRGPTRQQKLFVDIITLKTEKRTRRRPPLKLAIVLHLQAHKLINSFKIL